MEFPHIEGLLASLLGSPALLIVACCACLKLGAYVMNVLWSLCAGYLLHDGDFWTKLLPENKAYWKGRVAWVTGASRGVGLSLCRLLAQRGCRLIMSCRTLEDLQTAKQDVIKFCASQGLQKAQSDFLLLPFELNDLAGLDAVVKKAYAYTADRNIDFLFNNAAIHCQGMLVSYEVAEQVITADLLSQIKLTKLLLPSMAAARSGHIIFTNSFKSKIISCGHAPYSVAKAGLLTFADALSRDFKAKSMSISVTSAVLGYVRTGEAFQTLGPSGQPLTDDVEYMNKYITNGLPPDYVAKMILKAASNKLRECWIAKNAILVALYLREYAPGISSTLLDIRAEAYAVEVEEEIRELEEIAQRVRKN